MRTNSVLLGSAGAFLMVLAAATASTSGEAKTVAAPAKPAAFGKCAACHSVVKDGPSGVGPNLYAVGGRKAGTLRGYDYSSALKKSGVTWNRKTVDRYIADPNSIVPGSKMPKISTTAAERKQVIDYLAKLK